MSKNTPGRIVVGIMVDALAWFSAPCLFLYYYLKFPSVSAEAIAPHLWLVFIAFFLISTSRVFLAYAVDSHRVRYCVSALIVGLIPLIALLYYPLVILGLSFWGQVVSWDLIWSYLFQLPHLLDTLGLSLPLIAGGLTLVALLLLWLIWLYLRRFDWPRLVVGIAPKQLLRVGLGAAVLTAFVELHGIFMFPRDQSEPIVNTFYPRQGVHAVSGLSVNLDDVELNDRAADADRRTYTPNANAQRRNLILIVVDALRPDHLEPYGYKRPTTPNLKSLTTSAPSIAVPSVRSTCAESICGLFSIATSRYAHEVSARPFTIQQALKAHGYQVHMILGGDHRNFYGLRSLYGDLDSFVDGSTTPGNYVNSDLWVLTKAGELPKWTGTPTMFQFHLMSAHPLGKRESATTKFLPALHYSLPINATARTPENTINFYDNGVAQADWIIGKILDILRSKGYLEDALVVVTADHGEALGEHGFYSHARNLRDSAVRIPFIMTATGGNPLNLAPGRLAFSQVDIAPTILEELGMPRPKTWRGTPAQLPASVPVSYMQQGDEVGLIDHRRYPDVWKYWINVRSGEEYVFNLRTDPAEMQNVVSKAPPEWLVDWRSLAKQTRPPQTSQ